MKDINKYIIEKQKTFVLSDDERNSLIELVGIATEQCGEDSDIKEYEEFRKDCQENEINTLIDLYDLLNDKHTYPKINNRLIQNNELYLLIKLINYALDKDIIDLSEILEKIQ